MPQIKQQSQRDTIFLEEAEILLHDTHAGNQYILRVYAPECASHALPGCFAHVQCNPAIPMRRPLSIMRTDIAAGWVEFLYKVVGTGTQALSMRTPGEHISMLGPIGRPFRTNPDRPCTLLLGGGVGIPPMIFLADSLRNDKHWQPVVFMGSEVPFPFTTRPSRFLLPGVPDSVTAAMPLLEDWGIPSRLTSQQGIPGCHEGYITDLARYWLDSLDESQHDKVSLFACGPHPMVAAVAALAKDYNLPCQVSLEEFMACAVGGCAGCTVAVTTATGPAMKRVCVDGPVFDAESVSWS